MQLLKALVIGMGVLIVLAIGLLAYGLLTKTKGPAVQQETVSFERIALDGNAGCRIEGSTVEGQRLVVQLGPASENAKDINCEKIIIIDLTTGTVTGDIVLKP